MSEEFSELRRRLERLEGSQNELQTLMRESTLMNAMLNETLSEVKDAVRDLREELHKIHNLEIRVHSIEIAISGAKWLITTIVGTVIVVVIGFVLRIFGVESD